MMGFCVVGVAVLVLIFRFCVSKPIPSDQPSVTARHILMEHEAAANHLKQELGRRKGQALLDKFSELAYRHSECWSGASGGALGSIPPGKMAPAFDRVAWTAPLLTLQGPVQTPAGYHLIVVIQRSGHLPDQQQIEEKKKDQ